jgi:hypothetical protein
MPRFNRQEDFELGLSQLMTFFDALGFSLFRDEPQTDRSGTSYSARFIRVPRSVELNHLYSLGPVIYSIREFSVEHTYYIQALGVTAAAQFPCFADDSISGYPALLHDLQHLLSPFFVGSEADFIAIARPYMQAQQQHKIESGRLASRYIGEDRLKDHARELFAQGRYEEIVQIESEIKFPELLTNSERQMFSIARKRVRT